LTVRRRASVARESADTVADALLDRILVEAETISKEWSSRS